MARARRIGILTAGGDSPGLNAAIRGIGKAAIDHYGMQVIGFRDGFRGLAEDRSVWLDRRLSGILTVGGTVLGTSRDKPHRMEIGGRMRDMTSAIAANYRRLGLDALVCIGGGGTHKNALRLVEKGLHIITLPKTIDNDVALTDATIGFDTAQILKSVIDKGAPKNRAELRDRLAAVKDFDGATGTTRFDDAREAQKSLFLLSIEPKGIRELPPAKEPAHKPEG